MKTTHTGSCHCGKIRFEVDADIDHVRICDCSICRRRGALNFRVEEKDMRLLTPLEEAVLYQWGRKTSKDYFCPICGILPFRRPGLPTEQESAKGVEPFKGWAVNVRCLEDFDYSTLPQKFVHGSLI